MIEIEYLQNLATIFVKDANSPQIFIEFLTDCYDLLPHILMSKLSNVDFVRQLHMHNKQGLVRNHIMIFTL